jgi:beta-galactosidase GanA
MPELGKQGSLTQLIVDGEPFLILGGELGNSTASDRRYFEPIWPRLVELGLNTVLAPVYWELCEPEEGRYDFALVDQLVEGARRHGLRLVLLWFGSWKNSMSCYVPLWVKTQPERFWRARLRTGRAQEILSAFCPANREADARAFASLMRHLHHVDGRQATVLMVQVENEVGMLGDARDWCDAANLALREPVPPELLAHLAQHEQALPAELGEVWRKAGAKTAGTWEEVFGRSLAADEIFMAWHYARYTNDVARAGKREHPLPMFVNAALNRPGHQPGQYPSAGPLPHLIDVWQAGAPDLDFLSPDIYFADFAAWCKRYARPDNPLFVPEARLGEESGDHALYAIGQHAALGFSPFSIESIDGPRAAALAECYALLRQLGPLILIRQAAGQVAGVVVDRSSPTCELTLGDFRLEVAHDYTFEWSTGPRDAPSWPRFGGLVIALGPDEYLVAGRGLIVTFAPRAADGSSAGIAAIEEGHYEEGRWLPGRRLNGDQTHQGRHLRLEPERFAVQRAKLYRYR